MADTTIAAAVSPATRDLRKESIEDVLGRVERGFGVCLDRASDAVVRKRRSVGARTDRGTWVRVERRSMAKIAEHGQSANGMEAAALLDSIAKPAWYRSLCWQDFDEMALWRADEVQLIAEPPVQRGPLREGIALSDAWWATLNTSLDALARQRTTRIATPDTEVMTEGLVAREIERAFPGRVDTSIGDPWVPAHADLNWANLTGPGECWILDWEDHGLAPRGLDAANLWASSLTIPVLSNRVWSERRADLETSTGRLMALFCLAKIINDSSVPAPLHATATGEAEALIADLGR